MSVLAKLEEIEARLKAAETPTPWSEDVREFDNQDIVVGDDCLVAIVGKPGDRALIAHAPADLALLAKLIRSVVEAPCERSGSCTKMSNHRPWCWPCRIRRALEVGL